MEEKKQTAQEQSLLDDGKLDGVTGGADNQPLKGESSRQYCSRKLDRIHLNLCKTCPSLIPLSKDTYECDEGFGVYPPIEPVTLPR